MRIYSKVMKIGIRMKTNLEVRDMSNREKYNEAFKEALEVTDEQLVGLEYQDVPAWDSVGHMGLIDSIETAFDIQIDSDDIVDFNSYDKGIEILKKYNIIIE